MTELRDRLRAGEPLLGTFVKSPDATIAELLALAGYDLLVADYEHSALDVADLHDLARAGAVHGVPLVVRLPPEAIGEVGRILESGAAGIQLSNVTSPQLLAELRRASRFPPDGARSLSTAHRGADFGATGAAAFVAGAAPLLIAQVESAAGVEALPELLAAHPAPDAWFIGPYDLSTDLGHPGALDHPDVRRVLEETAAAILAAGVPLGIYASDAATAVRWRAGGATLVLAGSDLSLLRRSAGAIVGAWTQLTRSAAPGR